MRAISFFLPKILLIFALQLPSAVQPLNAQSFEFSGNRKNQTISFNLIQNLVIIPLYINGTGPYNFILDTGVGPMVITDTTLAQKLELKNLRPIKIAGLGKGLEIDAFVTHNISARIGKAEISNIPTAILKQDLLNLSNYVGIPICGLIGYHFFNSFVVELRYTARRLKFHRPETKRRIEGEAIPIKIENNKPYVNVEVDIPEIGQKTMKMVVDNGASHAISLETLNGKTFPVTGKSIRANLGIGLSGPIDGSIGRISTLKIGGFILKNLISSYPDYDNLALQTLISNRNGSLGAEVLSRFNITFDYNNDLMYLTQNYNFKRPFEHDMSGIELYVSYSPQKRYYISRIESGSPAMDAGLLEGDELISINFTSVNAMDLDEISRMMRTNDGRTLYLAINRNGDLLIRSIKLKKRI